jgi:hypothetical protein
MKQARSLLLALILSACPKPLEHVSEQQLVGKYVVSKQKISDSLTLRPNGTYVHNSIADGKPFQEEGHWDLVQQGGSIWVHFNGLCIHWGIFLGSGCGDHSFLVDRVGHRVILDVFSDRGLYYLKEDVVPSK